MCFPSTVRKHHNQKQHEEERIYFSLQFIIKASQTETEAEVMENTTGLLPFVYSASFLI